MRETFSDVHIVNDTGHLSLSNQISNQITSTHSLSTLVHLLPRDIANGIRISLGIFADLLCAVKTGAYCPIQSAQTANKIENYRAAILQVGKQLMQW